MSYENAPSTILLATHCCRCNRPLRDAVSVETGMGKDCRDAVGYGADCDAPGRAEANRLVHLAACTAKGERGEIVAQLNALGFPRLAAAVAKGEGELVKVDGSPATGYEVESPFNRAFVDALKAARIGARFDRANKTWRVPGDSKARAGLWAALRAHYAGVMLVTNGGEKAVLIA
jgi:hypothetical protein